jgi:hypothetical protein
MCRWCELINPAASPSAGPCWLASAHRAQVVHRHLPVPQERSDDAAASATRAPVRAPACPGRRGACTGRTSQRQTAAQVLAAQVLAGAPWRSTSGPCASHASSSGSSSTAGRSSSAHSKPHEATDRQRAGEGAVAVVPTTTAHTSPLNPRRHGSQWQEIAKKPPSHQVQRRCGPAHLCFHPTTGRLTPAAARARCWRVPAAPATCPRRSRTAAPAPAMSAGTWPWWTRGWHWGSKRGGCGG